jgi:large conductance mechanosensitive channel
MQSPVSIRRTPGWVAEFRAFIMRGNVVDLAVGIIIGVAFSAIVGSLVKDILNPIIGLVIGGVDFSNIFIPLNGQHYESLDAAQKAAAPTINIGLFINAIINFLTRSSGW